MTKERTVLEHREVGLIDWQQVQIGWKARHQLNESIVDLGEGSTVPARQNTPLRRRNEELKEKQGEQPLLKDINNGNWLNKIRSFERKENLIEHKPGKTGSLDKFLTGE